ncbi:kinase-like domain-containing protein [Polychytrium aggregatum]|uniref:kinase-like domain-containing protein n=1 Tax=Polychytrium aggregatum TaxID=110093 RepID=UPI0022FF0F6D|nr:kinase-like domain-containing protein [Polychytrium aggregatum]KAI9193290.1 kinase-like domain-containing protein [Polychytrium aggregatum]
MASNASNQSKIAELQSRLGIEKKVLDGAKAMQKMLTDPRLLADCQVTITSSEQRLAFIESELQKLLPRPSVSGASAAAPALAEAPEKNETAFDFLRADSRLTPEKVKFRLEEVRRKLDLETKVKAGTENMLSAMSKSPVEQKLLNELRDKIVEADSKITFLRKAEKAYSDMYVADPRDENEEGLLNEVGSSRKTGRVKVKMLACQNIPGRRGDDLIVAEVRVDGHRKGMTRPVKSKWDEYIEFQVDKASEIEICISDRSGPSTILLSFLWFKLSTMEDELKRSNANPGDMGEFALEMEPSGQVSLKLGFVPISRGQAGQDQLARRGPVQKVYPRNGHKFLAQQFYQVLQCALCQEFLSGQGYQCQNCQYTCHARCYMRVITKCITKEEINDNQDPSKDKNTGQLLKYNIPHRFALSANLAASWCAHCGYMLPIGVSKTIMKCTECGKACHKDHMCMMPHFCGLDPQMADQLVEAFEQAEKKMHLRELEEAAKAAEAAKAEEAAFPPPPPEFTTLPSVDHHGHPTPPARKESQLQLEKPKDADSSVRPSVTSPPREPLSQSPPTLPPIAVSQSQTQPPPQSSQTQSSSSSSRAQQSSAHSQSGDVAFRPPATVVVTKPRRKVAISLEDFNFIAVLGRGAFGKVMLAQDKLTKELYAIKALKKEFIIQNDDVASCKLEKRIFQAASQTKHPFLVNLHSCFQTDYRIYFVMEYVSGGDLMCHIQEKKRFSQGRAKFYACEVLLALEFFHKNNIIYRDLKLDNILLMPDGHIKVADYGICKENMHYGDTTRTFCGTPDYMAPEILLQNKYGRAVDWWSFGVLIYVMLVGKYPFHGDDENEILEAILDDSIEFPSNMPKETLSVLQGLLNKNPARRLGSGRSDAEEIKKHAYFAGVDWEAFMQKRVAPLFVPTIGSPTDTSNFDREFTKERPVLTPMNSVLSAADQLEFKGFTFISEWAQAARAEASQRQAAATVPAGPTLPVSVASPPSSRLRFAKYFEQFHHHQRRPPDRSVSKIHVCSVNEFNTSQVCSHCREAKRLEKVEHLDIEKPHFVRSCASCHTLWDRDINASRNMISLKTK